MSLIKVIWAIRSAMPFPSPIRRWEVAVITRRGSISYGQTWWF